MRIGAKGKTAVLAAAMAGLLGGCGVHDNKAGLDRQDYENLLARRGPEQARPAVEPPIPDLQPVLAAPTPPEEADQRRVTIAVTEQTPLKDVLIELARKAEVELELDPRIQGGVIFTARNRPFGEVVARIADLAGLRYTFKDNVLRMEQDDPYTENYRVDVLNLKRTVTSQISASTDVFAAVGGAGNAQADNGSTAKIAVEVENDFWTEIREGIQAIIDETMPEPRATSDAAATANLPGGAGGAEAAGAAGGGATASDAEEAGAAGQVAQAQQVAAQTAAATDAATTAGTADAAADGAGVTEEEDNGYYFTLNRQAGVIAVYAPQRTQRKVAEYLEMVREAISGQVLIEAKIIEVTLDDQFEAGIDWASVGLDDTAIVTNMAPSLTTPMLRVVTAPAALNFTATLDLLSQFGTTRTLSSPRLTVVNNETALLKVAENDVYFTIEIETEEDDNGNTTRTYTSELNTVPIGLLMAVQPSINRSTNRVSLNLRPTISRVVDRVEDPAVQLQLADINATNSTSLSVSSSIPVVEVREMDSVVNLESGATLVMGGLMQERSANVEQKVPGVGDIPLVGNAFRARDDTTEVVELVILLRATIVHDRETIHPADIDLYNKFAPDPRPFGF